MGKVKLRPQKLTPNAQDRAWYNVCKRTERGGILHTFRVNVENVPESDRQLVCGQIVAEIVGNTIRSMAYARPDPEQANYDAAMNRLLSAIDVSVVNMGRVVDGSRIVRDRRVIQPPSHAAGAYALIFDVFADGSVLADLVPAHSQPPEWERDPNADATPPTAP